MLRWTAWLLAVTAIAVTAGCAGASPPSDRPSDSQTAPTSPPASASPSGNSYGTFIFSGWLEASGLGPVDPLPFATLTGAVPSIPLGQGPGGVAESGSAPGTQCYHAQSRADLDQYEVLLVFVIRGQRYRLSIATEFGHPGAHGEPTPPAGGPMTDSGGSVDEVHFDPEGVALRDDPMFVGSFGDGTVVIAPNLQAGAIDLTLRGLPAGGGTVPTVHVTGSWTCP